MESTIHTPAALLIIVFALAVVPAFAQPRLEKPEAKSQPPGIKVRNGPLSMRITTNIERFISQVDGYCVGYNGVASLQHSDQKKNIFVHAGLNYECASVRPATGPFKKRWNAPRLAPMTIEKVGAKSVKLTQKGADASGVNIETVYTLGETYVDMTCTVWADGDVRKLQGFWASYMNQVQNTSLYLRASLKQGSLPQWLEMTAAMHGAPIVYRPFDPHGRDWHEYLTDNPVLRQAMKGSKKAEAAKAAQKAAGFKKGPIVRGTFGNFLYGFVDDYLFLIIFRPSNDIRFDPWLSPTGGGGLRCPAWDFGTATTRPVKAGEKITFYLRLVYKPFAGVDDLLKEVEAFQKAPAGK